MRTSKGIGPAHDQEEAGEKSAQRDGTAEKGGRCHHSGADISFHETNTDGGDNIGANGGRGGNNHEPCFTRQQCSDRVAEGDGGEESGEGGAR